MTHDGPSREEFYRAIEGLKQDARQDLGDIKSDVKAGFEAITDRLDVLNGRVQKGEVEREGLRIRITSVEHEVFPRPNRRAVDGVAAERRAITKSDAGFAAAAATVLYVCVKLLSMFGQTLYEFAKKVTHP